MLITITLAAFLVLVLVSLATLTRVETRVAENSQNVAQARANAVYALNLAIGQLQKYAGPDQAVTARADIDSANTGNPLWTGVWSSVPKDPSGTLLSVPTHNPLTASPAAPIWLVSGNESGGTALSPRDAAVADPATGNDNVWLVQRSLGRDLAADATHPQDGRIKLAKSAIELAAGSIPGQDATSTTALRVGSYAWWVDDEGVKAKLNLPDPYRSAASNADEADWRRQAPATPDLGLLSENKIAAVFAATPTNAFEDARTKLLSYDQLPMLDASWQATSGLDEVARYVQNLTTVGAGVLADTLRGGLRRDLTRGLAATPSAGSPAYDEIGDDAAVFVLPTPGNFGLTAMNPSGKSYVWTSNAEPHAPTWAEVRTWVSQRVGSANKIDPAAAPLVSVTKNGLTCPIPDGNAIMPVPVMLEIGYGLDVGADSKFRVMLRPVVVLMNPYNVTLNPATYSLTYQVLAGSKSDLQFTLKHDDYANTADWSTPAPRLDQMVSINGTPMMAFNITDGFGPGEIKVYSLPAAASGDVPMDGAASILDLDPGISTVHAYLETGINAPAWYNPSERDKMEASLGHLPQDNPYITLSLGKADPAAMPVPSFYARYIEFATNLYNVKPYPTARFDNELSRQLRTLRFTLRNAETDLVNEISTPAATQQAINMNLTADTVSGSRFLIDNNPRAVLSQRLNGRDGVAQYTVSSIKADSYIDIDFDVINGAVLGYWGGGEDAIAGSTHAVLFDVLRNGEDLLSVGRLGQFNWGVDAKHPAYPLGNSFASIFYPASSPDYGYALNEALWDRFFFSTLPTSLATRPDYLPDARLRYRDPDGTTDLSALQGMSGYELAASRLMIDGAFNINSTSVDAWAAFLGGVRAADYGYHTASAARTDSSVRAFPRTENLHDPDPTASGQSGNMYEWTGYRTLDDDQIKALAAKIVTAIKARGRPARSIAEFMNRDLSAAATDARNKMGVVQAAIDDEINTADPASGGPGLSDLPGLNTAKVVASTFANADNPDAARGQLRAAGAPGFLMQNDLLTPYAPAMSARSDTFRIRTYGEARNPVTGEIMGEAWCEAIVQRMPEYVGGESPELPLSSGALGTESKTFGRRFVVTGFRWLSMDEI